MTRRECDPLAQKGLDDDCNQATVDDVAECAHLGIEIENAQFYVEKTQQFPFSQRTVEWRGLSSDFN
jgi:hypothetical protein